MGRVFLFEICLQCFFYSSVKHCNQGNSQKGWFIWGLSFHRAESITTIAALQKALGLEEKQMKVLILNPEQEQRKNSKWQVFKLSKPTSCDILISHGHNSRTYTHRANNCGPRIQMPENMGTIHSNYYNIYSSQFTVENVSNGEIQMQIKLDTREVFVLA